MSAPIRFEFTRSESVYGWWVTLYLRGKHRARWNSSKATSRMWPQVRTGADENCNRSVSFILWPLGHLDVWWETNWRTDADGQCDKCRAEMACEMGGNVKAIARWVSDMWREYDGNTWLWLGPAIALCFLGIGIGMGGSR